MSQTLIKWRLREVMARYRIKAIDLAKEMGISANSISNLRNSESMPRLDGLSLNNLCNSLNKLATDLEEEITPMTLIDYTRDLEPEPRINLNEQTEYESTKQKGKKQLPKSESKQSSDFQVIVISEVQSA